MKRSCKKTSSSTELKKRKKAEGRRAAVVLAPCRTKKSCEKSSRKNAKAKSKDQKVSRKRARAKSKDQKVLSSGGIIKVGDIVDISELLFTNDKDFLITSNGNKVKDVELKGKVLIIYVMSMEYGTSKRRIEDLIETYNQLKELVGNGGFEVVTVAATDDDCLESPGSFICQQGTSQSAEERFTNFFQDMPWLAIPYQDRQAREHVERRLSLRIEEIRCQDEEVLKELSLVSLLGSDNCNFLVNNRGSKVLR